MNVHWDSNKCCHSGLCVKTLPDVFKIENGQFVIDPKHADDRAIEEVVRQCPSRALSAD